jgi:hypothetical protein
MEPTVSGFIDRLAQEMAGRQQMLTHYHNERVRLDKRFDEPTTMKDVGNGVRMSNMDIEAEYEEVFQQHREASETGRLAEKAQLAARLEQLAKARWQRR